MNSGPVLALHPSDNIFRTREPLDFEEDFVEKDPTGRTMKSWAGVPSRLFIGHLMKLME